MIRPGPHNDLTDVAGVRVGHHQRRGRGWLTGTTVVLPPPDTRGGVDVRGGGPGTRETDALSPSTLVETVDAVCLSGGSAYGLGTADGVIGWLAERRRGFRVGPEPHHVVPIVPTAVLFDLGVGGRFEHHPDAEFGRRAVAAAAGRGGAGPVRQGTVGAGAGSHAQLLKGGVGSASAVLPGGVTVAALVALNSSGSVFDPNTGELWGLDRGLADEFTGIGRPSRAELARHHAEPLERRPLNTTLAVVVTDADLTVDELTRMAGCGHDGMARAIDPIHQYVDGDVVFGLATGDRQVLAAPSPIPAPNAAAEPDAASTRQREPHGAVPERHRQQHGVIRPWATRPLDLVPIFSAAADAVTRAVVHAAVAATSAGPMVSYRDRFPSAVAAS